MITDAIPQRARRGRLPLLLTGFLIAVVSAPLAGTAETQAIRSPAGAANGKVAWLREHAVAVRSNDPGDEKFSDLEPLRQAIGDARIVLLGEASHGSGGDFLAKGRLIKFLHQEMARPVLP